jgi:hypothetical protein
VLDELQISDEMLALKYSQAKLAAFSRNREKIVRPLSGISRAVRIQQERSARERKIGGICP